MNLSIENLSKTYPNGVQALKNVSLNISSGLFGLLGPNGAGKSTLIRTLATLQEPDCGKVTFNDIDVLNEKNEVRKLLGYLPQEFGVYPKSTAEELLDYIAKLKGISVKKERRELVKNLLNLTNLYDLRKKALGGFSGGMKQRFGIAQALIGNPKLVIVDEPTAGLDPEERMRFHNLLSDISTDTIVILSTHIVGDVSDLCGDMAIIDKGELLFTGVPLDSIKNLEGRIWKITVNKSQVGELKKKHKVVSTILTSGKITVRIFNDKDPMEGFNKTEVNLEDVYFSIIKKYI